MPMINIINEKTKHIFLGFWIFTIVYVFQDFDEGKALWVTIFTAIGFGVYSYFSKKEKFDLLNLVSMVTGASIGYFLTSYFIL